MKALDFVRRATLTIATAVALFATAYALGFIK